MRQEICRDLLLLRIELVVILFSIFSLEGLVLLLFLLLARLVVGGFRLRLAFAFLSLLVLLLDKLVLSLLGLLLPLVPDPLKIAIYLLVSLRGLLGLASNDLHGRLLLLVESIEIRPAGQDLNGLEIPVVTSNVQGCVLSVLVALLRVSVMLKQLRHYPVVLFLGRLEQRRPALDRCLINCRALLN